MRVFVYPKGETTLLRPFDKLRAMAGRQRADDGGQRGGKADIDPVRNGVFRLFLIIVILILIAQVFDYD